jgi:homoserine O-acetyltransferase/O-succinyltransferase
VGAGAFCGAACADGAEKKTFALPSYTTVAGETIKSVKIGWESAGTLNSD